MTSPPREKKAQPLTGAPDSNRGIDVLICIFLAVAVIAVFGQTVRYGFVNLDDEDYVYENQEVVKGLTWQGVKWAFTHTYASNWHPLTWMSHMLDCQLYGLNPGDHHLTSVLLHAANAVLLFLVLRRMTGARWPSAFAAAVFAIHPLRVESVAWVSERKDVLSGFFFMLTLAAYVRYARHPFSIGRYLLVVLCFALGLMSKPMLVTLPFVLLLLDYWPLRRVLPTTPDLSRIVVRLLVEKIPLFALSVASCLVTIPAQGEAVATIASVPLALRVGNAIVSYATYLGQTVFPVGLAPFYPLYASDLSPWKVGLSAVLLLAISAGVLSFWRTRPCLSVGWLWYLGMLVPVIGLVQVGSQSHADRYTYLPQIGICLLVTWGAKEMFSRRRNGPLLLAGAALAIVAALAVGASIQTDYWHDNVSLWTHALACTSRNYAAHNNLGGELFHQGRTTEAIEQYQQALDIKPDFLEARYNLATALAAQGRPLQAIEQYQKAFAIYPGNAQAHSSLATILLGQGRTADAIEQYEKALEIKPDFAEAHYNLGNAFAAQRQFAEAIEQYKKAVELKPGYVEAHDNLANALASQGRTAEAIAQYEKTLEIKPDDAGTHNNLGTAFLREGRMDEAIAHYQTALKINPDFVEAHYNLGNVLVAQGRTAEAIEQYQQALRIRPDYTQARTKLERLQAAH